MLKNLMPKAQIKKMLKSRIVNFKLEMCAFIEDLLMQVADNTETNPFELVLILSKSKGIALGRVISPEHKCLEQFNAGAVIEEMVLRALSQFSEMARDFVLAELGDEDMESMVVKSLEGKSIFIHYGEDEELTFVNVTKKGKETIDLDEFISTLESEFNK